jgi:hypothetical protein
MKLVNEQQREIIFHTRCHISNKVCNMIIDSESYANIPSTILVKKLNLNIVKHDRPYKFRWLMSFYIQVAANCVPFFLCVIE